MHSTKHFREHDSRVKSIGDHLRAIRIPPRLNSFLHENKCENTCAKGVFFVYGYLMQIHLIGKEIETRLFRNGTQVGMVENREWDFNRQDQIRLETEVAIHKGDVFTTKCIYDSSKRTQVTNGGLPSTDEMCFNFVSFYPKKNGISHCYDKFCRPA